MTCVMDMMECPEYTIETCPGMFECSDGTCAASEMECAGFDPCPGQYTCSDMMTCAADETGCPEYELCPGEFECAQGICAPTEMECPEFDMCLNMGYSHTCDDGTCVNDSSECSLCWDGTPVGAAGECPLFDCSMAPPETNCESFIDLAAWWISINPCIWFMDCGNGISQQIA